MGPVPNGSGPKIGSDRPSVYTGPFRNLFGTDPKLDLLFRRSNSGPVPIRSGSVPNGSGPPVRFRVNVA